METAAGDCWVTVMGKVIVSTQHLQCRTWTNTPQKTFNCLDDADDDDVHSLKMYWLPGQRRVLQRMIPACYREH